MSRTITPISEQDYDQLRGMMRERAGVEFEPTRRFAIGSRISRRLHELGLRDATQYMSVLRDSKAKIDELDELLRLATITETSFNRYPRQLEYMRTAVLPVLIDSRRCDRTLRVWSVGCATGQEAYDLAGILRDVLGVRTRDWDVRILATDISRRAIEAGEHGYYSRAEARTLSDDALRRHFIHDESGVKVRDELRGMVTFLPHNLREPLATRYQHRFDLICCRNVLCHFGSAFSHECQRVLYDRLACDGVLLTGHRDPIERDLFEPMGDSDAQSWRRATIGS